MPHESESKSEHTNRLFDQGSKKGQTCPIPERISCFKIIRRETSVRKNEEISQNDDYCDEIIKAALLFTGRGFSA